MIQVTQTLDYAAWDNYVSMHQMSNAYQASHWQSIITKAYGYKAYGLAAIEGNAPISTLDSSIGKVVGLLPLVHLKSPIIGNRLISMPYFDHGGILADNSNCEEKLLHAAVKLGQKLKVQSIELRQLGKIECMLNDSTPSNHGDGSTGYLPIEIKAAGNSKSFKLSWSLRSHKVRLLLTLAQSSEILLKTFKSKLRSQINRPIKAGLNAKVGGMELLNDFYRVFCINMRDLGSPVHSKKLPQSVMAQFANNAKIVTVYKAREPIAAAIMVGYNNVMINPWASALRSHSQDSPNMLLYWTMLAYAADHGFNYFDFGRSTPEEGTYRFKTQWGAEPQEMFWYTIHLDKGHKESIEISNSSTTTFRAVIESIWRKLPVEITKWIGPKIRKHISL